MLAPDWVDLTGSDGQVLERLAHQPAAALGGSRFRPGDEDFVRMVANVQAAEIGVVFLIGGNGTMAGAQRLAAEAQSP